MTKIPIELCKNDIMEIIDLINSRRQTLLIEGYEEVEWEYYFYLAELEEKLVN